MKARFVVAPPGGGEKTEIRMHGSGWCIKRFEFTDGGKRKQLSEKTSATEAEVLAVLAQDEKFFAALKVLAACPELS